ncbi:MAG: prepilin-type N-terminal cleavage/methylation domain-containing protein [Phycisphaerales bacterium]
MNAPAKRRSFTLLELVLACALLAILLTAGAGAVGLAKKAARSAAAERANELSAALEELSADADCSTGVARLTANSLVLIVPDRNGDGEDESIEYSWSGTRGAPLLRAINGGTAETLATSLQAFSITSSTTSITVSTPVAKATERLVGGNSTGSGLTNTIISASNSRAASFVPANLGATATSWTLTRVRLMARQSAPVLGSILVQIQTSNAQYPSGTVLAETTINEADLSVSFAWKDVNFSTLTNLSTVSPLAIVVKRVSPAIEPCDLRATTSGGAMVSGNAYFSSSNSGSSWSMISGEDLIYAVYGIPTSPAGTMTATGVSSIRISAESTAGVAMHLQVPLSNIPSM